VTGKKHERLGEILLRANLIDEIQLRVALKEQKESRQRLGTTLVELGFVDEAVLAAFLSKQTDLPCINISNINISKDVLDLVPKELALKHSVVPVRKSGDVLYLAMADPTDKDIRQAIQTVTGLKISPMIAPEISLSKCLERHYEPDKVAAREGAGELKDLVEELENEGLRGITKRIDKLENTLKELQEAVMEVHDFLIPSGTKGFR